MVWNQDDKSHWNLSSPIGHGWTLAEGIIITVIYNKSCIPEFVLQLVKCLANSLRCTEMCRCGADEDLCSMAYESEDDNPNLMNSLQFV